MTEFWKTKRLDELSAAEWAALCDGCGLCCLRKLEEAETGRIHYTDVACRLLDTDTCRCRRYPLRLELVDDCVALRPDRLEELRWMPTTCAYRLRWEGRALPEWHPLVSGDPSSVHRAGISVRGRVVSEQFVHPDEIETRVVPWVETEN